MSINYNDWLDRRAAEVARWLHGQFLANPVCLATEILRLAEDAQMPVYAFWEHPQVKAIGVRVVPQKCPWNGETVMLWTISPEEPKPESEVAK